jgi:hypothetical protein
MRADHRWRRECGQSTALVTALLFVLVLFVGVVANVGQAVNRRIALQVVADAGAYTGASIMATGYNQLAFWNAALQYTWLALTFPPTGILPPSPVYFPFQADQLGLSFIPTTECKTTEGWIKVWKPIRRGIDLIYRGENIAFGMLAHSEAIEVSNFNAEDLFPGERLDYAEFTSLTDTLADPVGSIPPARSAFRLDDSPQVEDGTMPKAISVLKYIPFAKYYIVKAQSKVSYGCVTIDIPPIQYHTHTFPTWYRKSDGVKSFVWIVTAPETRALMFDKFFGGPALIPQMKAVAVAKPIGGDIEEGDWNYVVKMMPVATVMAGNKVVGSWLPSWLSGWTTDQVGVISAPESDRGRRIVTH